MPRVFKKSIVRYIDADGRQVPKGTPGARKVKEKSAKWYGRVPGAAKPIPLCRNEGAAEIMLNERVKKAELEKIGVKNDYEPHRLHPLHEHLADFEHELRSTIRRGRKRPPTAKQVALKVGRIRRVLDGCGFRLTADLSLPRVQEFLAELSADAANWPDLDAEQQSFTRGELAALLRVKPASVHPLVRRHGLAASGNGKARRYPRETALALLARQQRGAAVSTAGYCAREIKAFTRWLARRRRIADDPLADLAGATLLSDHRHDRRSLDEDELRRLLAAALSSNRAFRGLIGSDRHALYLTAVSTGFRVNELAALRPSDFDLDAEPATATLDIEHTKNRQTTVQPLPPDAAELLRGYLAGRPVDAPVWPGTWVDRAAEMLRIDLDAAGIAPVVDGPEGQLFVDFHSLRHSFVALLDKTGATLKQAMHLARHSDPKLTMARYGRPQLHDLGATVNRLPSLLSGDSDAEREAAALTAIQTLPLKATGTEGIAQAVTFSFSPVAQTCATERGSLTMVERPPTKVAANR
jgi:integrase